MASDDLFHLLKHCIPNDHARQVTSEYYVEKLMREVPSGSRAMDLGCGPGGSVDLFRKLDPEVDWHGVDIESSPEVSARSRTDAPFHTYDGVHLPFDGASFDIVYSHQVFEHVRTPEALLGEVTRVLKPGGAFIGSVSGLEPYHSFSIFNYTPYGWYLLLKGAGLELVELRPGIDSIALITRQFRGRPPELMKWVKSSPLNEEIDAWGAKTGRRPALINLRKLQYCGHIVFYARKA
jgi:SAM-dependent methyltransferase